MSGHPTKRPYHFATIPTDWFERAAAIGTVRALRVGFYLWQVACVTKTRRALRVSTPDIVFEVGGSASAACRGLKELQAAGLIAVRSRPRHAYLVDLPDDATLLRWLETDDRAREEKDDAVVWPTRPTQTREPRRDECTAVHP